MRPSLRILGPGKKLAAAAARRGLAVGGERPSIVVATGESTVMEAARQAEALGLPWPTVARARRFTDKLVMKRAFADAAIPHARYAAWPGEDVAALVAAAGGRVVVKPRTESSGRGRRFVDGARALTAALAELAPRYPLGLLIEQRLFGLEVSVETFVSRGRVVFQSLTEYIAYGEANLVGGAWPAALERRLRFLARRATLALGLTHGMTHAELFVTERGPVMSEIAMRAPGGHLMDLIRRAHGVDPWDLYVLCLTGDAEPLAARPRGIAANWLLHPLPGRVAAIHGERAVRELPGVRRVRLTAGPGDEVRRRTALGQMTGVVTLRHRDESVVRASLAQARQLLWFEMSPQA